MGLLRFILAVCVVLAHTDDGLGFKFAILGGTAVQCFYVLSGFFMTMILTEKYNRKGQVGVFYENRFLRVFSVYWIFLALNIALSVLNHFTHHEGTLTRWIESWPYLTVKDRAALVFSNIFLFGHDWAPFFQLGSNGIHRVANLKSPNEYLPTLYFVPQAWTLGVEVTFYLLAPFLVKRRWWVVAMLVMASFLTRWALASAGYTTGRWQNGFFPSEVGLFLLGTLAYKGYAAYKDRLRRPVVLAIAAATLFIVIAFPLIGHDGLIFFTKSHAILFTAMTLGVPALFAVTGRIKWERNIGELSYPIYLCHEIFTHPLRKITFIHSHPVLLALLAIGGASALSAVVVRFVDIPLNRYREMRLRRSNTAKDFVIPEAQQSVTIPATTAG